MFGTKKGNKIKYETNFGGFKRFIYLWFDYIKKLKTYWKNRTYETVDAHDDAVWFGEHIAQENTILKSDRNWYLKSLFSSMQ